MRRSGACLLLLCSCTAPVVAPPKAEPRPVQRTNLPASSAVLGASTPPNIPTASPDRAESKAGAFVTVVESGSKVEDWGVEVHGLPAIDSLTGSIIVPDAFRDVFNPAYHFSLLWLRAGAHYPFRVWTVLDSNDPDSSMGASGEDEGVRVRARDTNEMLASLTLRPTQACALEDSAWCTHPQRLSCGELTAEWVDDKLRWHWGAQSGQVALKSGTRRGKIGEVEANACIDVASLDAEGRHLVLRVTSLHRLSTGFAWATNRQWQFITLPRSETERADGKQQAAHETLTQANQVRKPPIRFTARGTDILKWDFSVTGLPALDTRSGAVIVADVTRKQGLGSTFGLSLLWLRVGERSRARILSILDESVAGVLLNDDDTRPFAMQPVAANARELAVEVRERTRDANEMLSRLDLRPITKCNVQRMPDWCSHPQRFACAALTAELQGDRLHWQLGTTTKDSVLGWSVAPMLIGDGPAKEIIPCVEEAYFEPESSLLVARTWDSCKEPGSDACFGGSQWRIAKLR